jgi:hypothetical protein
VPPPTRRKFCWSFLLVAPWAPSQLAAAVVLAQYLLLFSLQPNKFDFIMLLMQICGVILKIVCQKFPSMDKKKRKRTVYTHSASIEETSLSNASKRRVHIQHNPAPPRSPEKGRALDNFDHLMGFAGDDELYAPVLPEGPAALKIKVKKAKRYDNSVGHLRSSSTFINGS